MGVASLALDITARKQAEAALQQEDTAESALQSLQQTQTQLIQAEKMSGLGQLVAGVAHEINNPVNFIHGNLTHTAEYTRDLLELVTLYQHTYLTPNPHIEEKVTEIDLDFMIDDLPKMLSSLKVGADHIRQIVLSLRNFSRLDEAELKPPCRSFWERVGVRAISGFTDPAFIVAVCPLNRHAFFVSPLRGCLFSGVLLFLRNCFKRFCS